MRPSNLWKKNGVEVEWFHSFCRKSLESVWFLDYCIYLSKLLGFSNLNSPCNMVTLHEMNIWLGFTSLDVILIERIGYKHVQTHPQEIDRLASLLASRKACSRSVPWPSASPVSWQQIHTKCLRANPSRIQNRPGAD